VHQRRAVGDAVMNAGEQHGTSPVVLDKVGVPERSRHVERGAHQIADKRPQRSIAAPLGKSNTVHVGVEVEVHVR
jgi:hypothetical protein